MADHIAIPQNLLKHLEKEIRFLSELMSEMDRLVTKADNISIQAIYLIKRNTKTGFTNAERQRKYKKTGSSLLKK